MRVLAINDVSCVGKCSLTATLPIISACGIECNVLPTALLSTHTGGFSGYTFRDLTGDIPAIIGHWKRLGLQFDYIYSGYLGSIEQIDLVIQCKRELLKKDGILVVDPVMGDSGKLYDGFTPAYVEKMRSLCTLADYILPNVTEAAYLTELPYPFTRERTQEALLRLTKFCPNPIITGLVEKDSVSVHYVEKGLPASLSHENVQGFFCGAGDVFASAFVGCLARGKSQTASIAIASDFVATCIRRSDKEVPDKRFGLSFESEIFPFLKNLNE